MSFARSCRTGRIAASCRLLVLLLMLSACATRESRIEGVSAAHSASELQRWTAQGRIAVIGVNQSGSGSFMWIQHDADATVQLRGPVGVGSLQLSLQGEVLHVVSSDGTHYDADAALNELQARLGTPLPISQLRYWLRLLPAPGEYQWLSGPGKILQQAGWRIEYGELISQGTVQLPTRLNATQLTDAGELRIRVAIEHWQLQP